MNFILTDLRDGEAHTIALKDLPRLSEGIEASDIWQNWLRQAVGFLVCQGPHRLHQANYRCSLSPVGS